MSPSPMQQQFKALGATVFADGALSAKTKQLIAYAVAHVGQAPICIREHAARAVQLGATRDEMIEAMWVATVMLAATRMGGSGLEAETDLTEAIRRLTSSNSHQ